VSDALALVAEPRRAQILRLVWFGERSAGDIAAELPVTFGAVSQHLRVLREARLVAVRPAATGTTSRVGRVRPSRRALEARGHGAPPPEDRGRGQEDAVADAVDRSVEVSVEIAAKPSTVWRCVTEATCFLAGARVEFDPVVREARANPLRALAQVEGRSSRSCRGSARVRGGGREADRVDAAGLDPGDDHARPEGRHSVTLVQASRARRSGATTWAAGRATRRARRHGDVRPIIGTPEA
jgi:DNA-binding transcriptional ArsR family regulator